MADDATPKSPKRVRDADIVLTREAEDELLTMWGAMLRLGDARAKLNEHFNNAITEHFKDRQPHIPADAELIDFNEQYRRVHRSEIAAIMATAIAEEREYARKLKKIDHIDLGEGLDHLANDFGAAFDGERELTIMGGGKTFRFELPIIIDRGTFNEAKSYRRGDAITHDGGMFIAQVSNPKGVPGKSSDWRLGVKRGKPATRWAGDHFLADWTPPPRPARPRPQGRAVTQIAIRGRISSETLAQVAGALKAAPHDSLAIKISSEGGDAVAGLGIYEELITHPHRVTVDIVGQASSAAALIAMGGDHRRIASTARMVLHKTQGGDAALCAAVDRAALKIFTAATRQWADTVTKWEDVESTFVGAAAVRVGLAHEVIA